jgi:hypothetical protein
MTLGKHGLRATEVLHAQEDIDVSMAHLKERLIRDFEKYRQLLIVNVIVMAGDGKRGWGGFTNQRASGYISRDFNYEMNEYNGPGAFASGSAAVRADANGLFDVVKEQLHVRPRHVRDHMNMLAVVNRRVAEADRLRAVATGVKGAVSTVSPFCHVAFMPATDDGKYQPESRVYTKPGEVNPAPFTMPPIWRGIDTTFYGQQMGEAFRSGSPPTIDPEEAKRAVERRP